jgi:pimeloyl-ACP methyl ester carboxylesterase
MSLPKEILLKLPNFHIAGQAWGDPNHKKILALHGWLDNSNSFKNIAPLIPDSYLIAIDITGHGHSDHRPAGSIYHFIDAVPQIVAVADFLKWDTFNLLGHSMGAGIATLLAGTVPERVEKLALIEGLGPWSRGPDELPENLKKFIEQDKVEKRLPIYKTQEDAARARKQAGDLSMESAVVLTERGLKEVPGGYTWRSDPRLKLESPLRMTEEQVLAFIQRITCPTYLVARENGLKWKKDLVENRMRNVKNLTTLVLPGGHHLHMDDPKPVADALSRFIRQ